MSSTAFHRQIPNFTPASNDGYFDSNIIPYLNRAPSNKENIVSFQYNKDTYHYCLVSRTLKKNDKVMGKLSFEFTK